MSPLSFPPVCFAGGSTVGSKQSLNTCRRKYGFSENNSGNVLVATHQGLENKTISPE
jgi:hypothetical protein